MTTHLEETLDRDMSHLRDKISGMAGLAVSALNRCVHALQHRDRSAAYSVILRDQRIDETEKEIDRLCLEFIVRHQPAGAHLRFVYGAIKVNAELERIGDYAESIARQILRIGTLEPPPPIDRFIEIARLAIPMLQDAVRAFLDRDPELARTSMEVEARADELRNLINEDLMRLHQGHHLPLEALNPLMTIARRFERVADQAKNICEEALYVCTGEYAKHPGAEGWRILFIDEHNACLSRMAEAIGCSLNRVELRFASAGTAPRALDAFLPSFMAGRKIELPGTPPRSLQEVAELEHCHVVVSLSPGTRKSLSSVSSKAVVLHWHVQDPSTLKGTSEEVLAAYDAAFQFLTSNIHDLVAAIFGNNSEAIPTS